LAQEERGTQARGNTGAPHRQFKVLFLTKKGCPPAERRKGGTPGCGGYFWENLLKRKIERCCWMAAPWGGGHVGNRWEEEAKKKRLFTRQGRRVEEGVKEVKVNQG